MQARYSHAAGIVTDEVTDEHFVAVTGGFGYLRFLDSTEILQDGEWDQGKIILEKWPFCWFLWEVSKLTSAK